MASMVFSTGSPGVMQIVCFTLICSFRKSSRGCTTSIAMTCPPSASTNCEVAIPTGPAPTTSTNSSFTTAPRLTAWQPMHSVSTRATVGLPPGIFSMSTGWSLCVGTWKVSRRPPSTWTPITRMFMQQFVLPCLHAMQLPQCRYGSTEQMSPGLTFCGLSAPSGTSCTVTQSSCPMHRGYSKNACRPRTPRAQARRRQSAAGERRRAALHTCFP